MAKPKRRKKKKPLLSSNALIGIFIVLLMVGSGVGLMLGRNPPNQGGGVYNDYTFERGNSGWSTQYEGSTLEFRYLPDMIENLEVSGDALSTLQNTPGFYLTYDPNDKNIQSIEVARLQLERTFSQKLEKYMGVGVVKSSPNYEGFPIITCENASQNVPVVYFKTSNSTGFEYEKNCLHVNFQTGSEVFMLKDRLMYGITGIIENG